MNGLPADLVEAAGSALLHFVWKGVLVGMATALLLKTLRNSRPQVRYAVLCGALLLCLVIPSLDVYRYVGAGVPAAGVSAEPGSMQSPIASLRGFVPWLVAGWSLGVAVMMVRLATGLLWIGRVADDERNWADVKWQAQVSRVAAHWGIRRRITLRIVRRLQGPLTAGWWRPVILIPAALLTQMPPALLEALLAHEVAHIRRLDYLVNLVQVAIEALLFYHPVVWWLSSGIRIEREKIADALAATYIGEPRSLALALEQLSHLGAESEQMLTLAQPAGRSKVADRIRQLIRPGHRSASWKAIAPATVLAMALACMVLHTHLAGPAHKAMASSAQDVNVKSLEEFIHSNHALVIDDSSGKVLLQKNAGEVAPIASLTKLMTAMVVLDEKPDMKAVVNIDAIDAGAANRKRAGVPVGTSLPLKEVMRLALMSSDNRAAYALARRYPGGMPAFERALRAKITALGLTHTTLDEPTGLSARNTSTAADMAVVASAAARYPDIAQGTTTAADIVDIDGRKVEYRNTNPLVGQQGWNIQLSKTGFIDEAGRCMVMRLQSSGRSFTMVLLNSHGASALTQDITNIRDALQAGAAAHRA